ncbi:sensor histidine kinase [Actinomadura meridiana]|uniref:histidine kinase n=1 Tax=Actinomadura meridiana TaxID=559626 RepID=A0ABP8C498_9ACTN
MMLAAGIAVWIRLPSPRVGQLIVLGSATYYLQFLRATGGLLFTIGFCLAYAWTAIAEHVLLAWPSGRLDDPITRTFVVVSYVVAIGTQVIRYHVDHPRPPWGPQIGSPGSQWGTIGSAAALVIGLTAVALAIRRRRASPVRLLPSGPVWGGIAVAALVKIAEAAVSVFHAPDSVILALAWLFTVVAILIVPMIIAIRGVQLRFGHRRVVELLLSLRHDLAVLAEPATLQQTLSRTLGDPTLTVAYRLSDGGYVGIDGQPADLTNSPGRSVTLVRRRGEIIAAITHDVALDEQPKVTNAAVAAAGLAIDNAHLYARMQAHLEQLRDSRLRLAQTAFDERQRIQRDLHDGTQEGFLTVLMLLDQVRRTLTENHDPSAEPVSLAHTELTAALRTLRELTQGIYPTVLHKHGLATAIATIVDQAPIPVDFEITPERWPDHIEMTAYFVVSEALANVYKHSAATHARINIHADGDRLVTTVSDDGNGIDRPTTGLGLTGLRHRVDAVGGTVTLESLPGRGTTLRVEIPRHHTTEQP